MKIMRFKRKLILYITLHSAIIIKVDISTESKSSTIIASWPRCWKRKLDAVFTMSTVTGRPSGLMKLHTLI